MGLLGSIIGSVSDGIRNSSDSKYIEEIKPKMMNSAIADDFEFWFRSQLNLKSFLYSQYNFYDNCERLVIVDDDCVAICFEIEKANVRDECVCNFATTLGYTPLSASGLHYSNGKSASERVLIKAFAEIARQRMEKVFNEVPGNFKFGLIEYDDGTDKNAGYLDQLSQKTSNSRFYIYSTSTRTKISILILCPVC